MSKHEFDPFKTDYASNPARRHRSEDILTPGARKIKDVVAKSSLPLASVAIVIATLYVINQINEMRNNIFAPLPDRPAPTIPYEEPTPLPTEVRNILTNESVPIEFPDTK